MVFFTESTLHGSNANHSDGPRLGFSLRFTTPEVKFDVETQRAEYITGLLLVRGEDRYHHNDALRVDPPSA